MERERKEGRTGGRVGGREGGMEGGREREDGRKCFKFGIVSTGRVSKSVNLDNIYSTSISLYLFFRWILRSTLGRTFPIASLAIHREHTSGMTRGYAGDTCQKSPTITPWCLPVLPSTIGE